MKSSVENDRQFELVPLACTYITENNVYRLSSVDRFALPVFVFFSNSQNKKLSCRKETVRLLRGSVLAKCNFETIICGHFIGLSSTTVT